jgi:hypothetical protein
MKKIQYQGTKGADTDNDQFRPDGFFKFDKTVLFHGLLLDISLLG